MPSEESTFRPAMKLMSGRMAAFAITFLSPILLVRIFSQSEFGTYKQFMLITYTPYLIGCAFSECLFYFVPRDPARAPRYALNSMLMLFTSGMLGLIFVVLNRSRIAGMMSNPALEPYVPMIGLYLLFTLMGTVLEITMISRKKYSLAAATYVASDLLRAAFLVVPALITRSLAWALAGSIVFFALRVVAVLGYLRWEFGGGIRLDRRLLREQWAYAMPYSLAGIVYVIQQNYHQYVVAYHFDAATFAVYSVGCLQIPLVDFLATPTSNVMMVRMAERLRDENPRDLLDIWHDTTRKLALLFFPLVCVLFVNACTVITLLFTASYAASVPIFMVSCLSILLATLQTDGVLRVFAEIRYLFVTNVVRLGMLLVMMSWFLSAFGLMGAVTITLLGIVLAKVMALVRICRILQTSCSNLFPWTTLGLTLMAAVAATLPCLIINARMRAPAIVLLPAAAIAYAVTYAGLILIFRLLSREEIGAIKSMIWIWNRRPAQSANGLAMGS
jgi:O-antigen/teichoic acid export membrane protein